MKDSPKEFPKSSIFFPREQPMYMDVILSLEATQDKNQEEAKEHEDFYDEQQEEIAPAAALLLDRDRRRHHGNQGEEAPAALVLAHDGAEEEEWEHMFDKVVTPSDVGKLNRLVVPKQHAERCFPAPAAGMELCFQDRAGTPWRFRYSYWGSSQSYVMTKGWSLFIRAAGLTAGDTVSSSRSCAAAGGGGSRYFINCHHRQSHPRRRESDSTFGAAAVPAALRLFRRVQTVASGGSSATVVFDTVLHVVAGHHVEVGLTSLRSFRLFGVNVEECGGDEVAAVLEVGDVEEHHA